jgi:hypothetical protein
VFWDAFNFLRSNGLIQIVPHLVEAYTDEGEIIFSQGYAGEDGEREVAFATSSAAEAMLAEWQLKRLESEACETLIPVLSTSAMCNSWGSSVCAIGLRLRQPLCGSSEQAPNGRSGPSGILILR